MINLYQGGVLADDGLIVTTKLLHTCYKTVICKILAKYLHNIFISFGLRAFGSFFSPEPILDKMVENRPPIMPPTLLFCPKMLVGEEITKTKNNCKICRYRCFYRQILSIWGLHRKRKKYSVKRAQNPWQQLMLLYDHLGYLIKVPIFSPWSLLNFRTRFSLKKYKIFSIKYFFKDKKTLELR